MFTNMTIWDFTYEDAGDVYIMLPKLAALVNDNVEFLPIVYIDNYALLDREIWLLCQLWTAADAMGKYAAVARDMDISEGVAYADSRLHSYIELLVAKGRQ